MSMTAWNRSKTEVEHLTLHYQGNAEDVNKTILRLRVERLLDTVDVQPAGLPSGAVFIVRKLEQPAPLPVAALSYTLPQNWKESMREQMDSLYRAAVRPGHGPVSPDASSVLFTDAGEMLTCLTRDLLVGEAWQRWYWRALLRNVPRAPGSALATLWSKQASFVPIVFASLNVTEANAALNRLSPDEIYAVICALHASFELPSEPLAVLRQLAHDRSLDAHLFDPSSSGRNQTVAPPDAILPGSHPQTNLSPEPPARFRAEPPWQRWLDSSAAYTLTPQAHYLLGLGLTLLAAPTFARSEKFTQQALSWLRAPLMHPIVPGERTEHIASFTLPPPQQVAHGNIIAKGKTGVASSSAPSHEPPSDAASIPSLMETVGNASPAASLSTLSSHDHVFDTTTLVREEAEEVEGRESRRNKAASPQSKLFTFGARHELPLDGIDTELGGILYLLHLLTWLNLPDSWDEDGTFAEGLSGWATVEALARCLPGAWHESYVNDPIWSLLALLDQREPGSPVGMKCAQPSAFRLPLRWLPQQGVSEAAWVAQIDDSRLLLFDEAAGYLFVDVPLAGRTLEEAVLAEIERYASYVEKITWHAREGEGAWKKLAGPLWSHSVASYVSEPIAWWLRRVQGFIRAFLLRRLDNPEFDADQLAIRLLNRPGRVIASRTHVDLYMSMEQISLPIRLAGLDRDPGWMPDLGRIVLFHFQ